MLIGSYGEFWQRDLVDWSQHGWRLLGRRNLRAPALQIADFRRARGVYVLYDDVGTYYVGLAGPNGTIGARIKAHTTDHLAPYWSRFSWFSFDSPCDEPDADGIRGVDQYDYYFHGDAVEVVIRDFEALLQRAAVPLPTFSARTSRMARDGYRWPPANPKSGLSTICVAA